MQQATPSPNIENPPLVFAPEAATNARKKAKRTSKSTNNTGLLTGENSLRVRKWRGDLDRLEGDDGGRQVVLGKLAKTYCTEATKKKIGEKRKEKILAEACIYSNESLAVCREHHAAGIGGGEDVDWRERLIGALHRLGCVQSEQGNWQEAVESYNDALKIIAVAEAPLTDSLKRFQFLCNYSLAELWKIRFPDDPRTYQQASDILTIAKRDYAAEDASDAALIFLEVCFYQMRWSEIPALLLLADKQNSKAGKCVASLQAKADRLIQLEKELDDATNNIEKARICLTIGDELREEHSCLSEYIMHKRAHDFYKRMEGLLSNASPLPAPKDLTYECHAALADCCYYFELNSDALIYLSLVRVYEMLNNLSVTQTEDMIAQCEAARNSSSQSSSRAVVAETAVEPPCRPPPTVTPHPTDPIIESQLTTQTDPSPVVPSPASTASVTPLPFVLQPKHELSDIKPETEVVSPTSLASVYSQRQSLTPGRSAELSNLSTSHSQKVVESPEPDIFYVKTVPPARKRRGDDDTGCVESKRGVQSDASSPFPPQPTSDASHSSTPASDLPSQKVWVELEFVLAQNKSWKTVVAVNGRNVSVDELKNLAAKHYEAKFKSSAPPLCVFTLRNYELVAGCLGDYCDGEPKTIQLKVKKEESFVLGFE